MALLLGSDYTIGVKGIGPVNATEIVQAFYDFEGLQRFKEWTDKGTFQDTDEMVQEVKSYHNAREDVSKAQIAEDIITEVEYKRKHRELIKHWEFPSGFPSKDVIEGYTKPYIDEMEETKLSWGKPDFAAIKRLALNQLKWHPAEIKNCIEVTEKKRERGWNITTQKTMNDYFTKQHKFAQFKSKRIINAVGKMKRKQDKRVKSH